MSQVELIKEELGWLKVIFVVLATVDVSLVAWLVQNYQIAKPLLVWLASGGVVVGSLILVWVNRVVYGRLEVLENL